MNRQVSALLAAGLLRERADLTESGAIGRPRIPVEVDHEPFLTVGIHIGAVTTGIVAADLRGRIISAVEIPTPSGDQDIALASIAASAKAFVSRWHRRTALWAGVAIGGRVDSATGIVDHPRLGWSQARVGEAVGLGLRLPVSVAAHVEAMAAAELLLTPNKTAGDTAGAGLYIYARETAGIAITFDGKVIRRRPGPGRSRICPPVRRRGAPAVVPDASKRRSATRRCSNVPVMKGCSRAVTSRSGRCTELHAKGRKRHAPFSSTALPRSAGPSRSCAICSTPTAWFSADRPSPSTPKESRTWRKPSSAHLRCRTRTFTSLDSATGYRPTPREWCR